MPPLQIDHLKPPYEPSEVPPRVHDCAALAGEAGENRVMGAAIASAAIMVRRPFVRFNEHSRSLGFAQC